MPKSSRSGGGSSRRPTSHPRFKITLAPPGSTRGAILVVDDKDVYGDALASALRARGFFTATTKTAHASEWAHLPIDAMYLRDEHHIVETVSGVLEAGFGGALLLAGRDRHIPDTQAIAFPTPFWKTEVAILQAIPGGHLSICPMKNPYGTWLDDRVINRVFGGDGERVIVGRLLNARFDIVLHEEMAEAMGIVLSPDAEKRRGQLKAVYQAVYRVRDKLCPLGVGIETETNRGYRLYLTG